MMQGIVSESFGFRTAFHVLSELLRGWLGLFHGAVVYYYFTNIPGTAVVLQRLIFIGTFRIVSLPAISLTVETWFHDNETGAYQHRLSNRQK